MSVGDSFRIAIHTCHVLRFTFYLSRFTSHVLCFTGYISRFTFHISHFTFHLLLSNYSCQSYHKNSSRYLDKISCIFFTTKTQSSQMVFLARFLCVPFDKLRTGFVPLWFVKRVNNSVLLLIRVFAGKYSSGLRLQSQPFRQIGH